MHLVDRWCCVSGLIITACVMVAKGADRYQLAVVAAAAVRFVFAER